MVVKTFFDTHSHMQQNLHEPSISMFVFLIDQTALLFYSERDKLLGQTADLSNADIVWFPASSKSCLWQAYGNQMVLCHI